ncbi:MAG TPA: ABC transporter permease, partial [Bacillota bacterium]|nr:ABC transporter permease [Bacillota bacterium]
MFMKKQNRQSDNDSEKLEMELITDADASSGLKGIWSRFLKHKMAVVSLFVIVLLLLIALLAPFISPYDPDAVDPINRLSGPNAAHLLGQDQLGRDILSRIIWGSRVSLSIGFLAGSISLVVGVFLGALAGFYGGWVDNVIMRIAEIFVTIPQFLLVIAVVAALGPSLNNLMIVIGLTSWNGYARQVRAKVMQIKQLDYTEAARALGCDD